MITSPKNVRQAILRLERMIEAQACSSMVKRDVELLLSAYEKMTASAVSLAQAEQERRMDDLERRIQHCEGYIPRLLHHIDRTDA